MPHNLRILFVNRMAGLVRGGGETFDLEISRALEQLGCEVHYLTGAPMFGEAPLPIKHPRVHYLHAPYLPWFPWDKMKGGWRIKEWEFRLFERKAARWIKKHAGEFDVIQVCELTYLVTRLKDEGEEGVRSSEFGVRGRGESGAQPATCKLPAISGSAFGGQNQKSKIVLRLTAPNAHDPWGGIQLADAVIASGTSIEKIRKTIRPDVVDVPNGVDLERFKEKGVQDSGFGVRGKEVGDNIQHSTSNAQHSSGDPSFSLSQSQSKIQNPKSKICSFRQRYGIPISAPVLLYVARFQAFKNHKLLIDAFRRVLREFPEARLVLAGSGPLMREAKEMCAKEPVVEDIAPNNTHSSRTPNSEPRTPEPSLANRVLFLGEVPHEELPAINQAATVAVISSAYESFCFSAIEAMACGLPVVTTDCGWVPKLIGDENPPVQYQWPDEREDPGRFAERPEGEKIREVPGGMVVMRNDAVSLAGAMVKMLRDEEMRERCGRWNREKAEREHGWSASAERLLEVYRGIVRSA